MQDFGTLSLQLLSVKAHHQRHATTCVPTPAKGIIIIIPKGIIIITKRTIYSGKIPALQYKMIN